MNRPFQAPPARCRSRTRSPLAAPSARALPSGRTLPRHDGRPCFRAVPSSNMRSDRTTLACLHGDCQWRSWPARNSRVGGRDRGVRLGGAECRAAPARRAGCGVQGGSAAVWAAGANQRAGMTATALGDRIAIGVAIGYRPAVLVFDRNGEGRLIYVGAPAGSPLAKGVPAAEGERDLHRVTPTADSAGQVFAYADYRDLYKNKHRRIACEAVAARASLFAYDGKALIDPDAKPAPKPAASAAAAPPPRPLRLRAAAPAPSGPRPESIRGARQVEAQARGAEAGRAARRTPRAVSRPPASGARSAIAEASSTPEARTCGRSAPSSSASGAKAIESPGRCASWSCRRTARNRS